MTEAISGIIGLGFLGREIVRIATLSAPVWATIHSRREADASLPSLLTPIPFDWGDRTGWDALPVGEGAVILTVPPLHEDIEQERDRLRNWGAWMAAQRPGYRRLVYISTTGVYPARNGCWKETDTFDADSPKGRLRLASEAVLAGFFDLRVIRSGAIYGKGRNVAERIRAGKPIPSAHQPVHRIHVADLARIALQAATDDAFPSVVNAVDMDPASTSTVAEWLMQQGLPGLTAENPLTLKDGFETRTQRPPSFNRLISNRRLIEIRDFDYLYPSYREGLPACMT